MPLAPLDRYLLIHVLCCDMLVDHAEVNEQRALLPRTLLRHRCAHSADAATDSKIWLLMAAESQSRHRSRSLMGVRRHKVIVSRQTPLPASAERSGQPLIDGRSIDPSKLPEEGM